MDMARGLGAAAYALRDRVSTREAFNITSDYYDSVVGDFQKAREIFQMWAQTYPQDGTPLDRLGNDYLFRVFRVCSG